MLIKAIQSSSTPGMTKTSISTLLLYCPPSPFHLGALGTRVEKGRPGRRGKSPTGCCCSDLGKTSIIWSFSHLDGLPLVDLGDHRRGEDHRGEEGHELAPGKKKTCHLQKTQKRGLLVSPLFTIIIQDWKAPWKVEAPLLLGIHISFLGKSDPEGISTSAVLTWSSFRWLPKHWPGSFQTPRCLWWCRPRAGIPLPVRHKDSVEKSLLGQGNWCGGGEDKDRAAKAKHSLRGRVQLARSSNSS